MGVKVYPSTLDVLYGQAPDDLKLPPGLTISNDGKGWLTATDEKGRLYYVGRKTLWPMVTGINGNPCCICDKADSIPFEEFGRNKRRTITTTSDIV